MAKKKKKQVLVSDHDDSTSPNQEQGLAEEALEELERALVSLLCSPNTAGGRSFAIPPPDILPTLRESSQTILALLKYSSDWS